MLRNGSSREFFASCSCCAAPAAFGMSNVAATADPVSRRQFVVGGMASLALGATAKTTRLLAQPNPRRIDVHHHVSPAPFVDALKKAHLDTPPIDNWTAQKSLDDMDQGGTATAIVSVVPGLGSFLGPAEAAAVARASNEWTRKLADEHKGRFGMFALMPMPHPDETVKEIEYAFDTLKADGVVFMTSYGDKYLGNSAFTPVMEELNRRKATAYTHPPDPACCSNNLAGFLPAFIEYGTDTARTIASLIFSHTSTRFPEINFIFSHGGGTITVLTDRLTFQMMLFPQYREFTGAGVMAELRRFYYESAQIANPIAMASLTKMVAMSQILFVSDYPYRNAAQQVPGLENIFTAEDMHKINRDNALKLLPRWRQA
jgi:predicted TIM-barrel fold metal-dependent hydrolase